MSRGKYLRRRRRWGDLLGLALGVLLILGAVGLHQRGDRYRVPPPVGDVPLAAAASTSYPSSHYGWSSSVRRVNGPRPPPRPPRLGVLRLAPPPTPSPPRSLTIPSQVIGGAVVPVGYDNHTGELGVPPDAATLGWWSGSALPGASSGTVVIDGHVDTRTDGKGVLFNLERVAPGQRIQVLTADGVVTYRAVARRSYEKADLPADVFARSGQHRLVLITCGGPFNQAAHHYAYNIVVYAVPA